jgi:hypothetical protein
MTIQQSPFTAVYGPQFSDRFKQKYQSGRRLSNVCDEQHGAVGDAFKFKYIGQSQMQKYGANNADIPTSNPVITSPILVYEDFVLKLTISDFDQKNFNASALEGLTKNHVKALARTEDQVIINAGTDVNVVTNFIPDDGDFLTTEKLIEARVRLGINAADSDELYFVTHWRSLGHLLGQTQYTSADFNYGKPLVAPTSNPEKFGGFKIIAMPDMKEGGLPISNGIRTSFCFARDALAVIYREDPMVQMVPVPNNLRTETISSASFGALVCDPLGAIRVLCKE